MQELLKGDRTRTVLLNGALFLLFGCAWLSDRNPNLATAGFVAAAVIVCIEVALLFKLRRSGEHRLTAAVATEEPDALSPAHEWAALIHDEVSKKRRQALWQIHRNALAHSKVYGLDSKQLATHLVRWTVEHPREKRFQFLVAVKELERRQPRLTELENWRLNVLGDEAFNIAAGAFEIEHFHGKTNIRVLDASRVTVEGEKRGSSLHSASPGLSPPTYQ